MTTLPTRQQVDQAQPLEFNAPRQERQANITISGQLDGFNVEIEFTAAILSIPSAIEKLKAIGMSSAPRTMTPAQAPPAAPGRAKAETVDPIYQPDGTPCCPTHRKPLAEGRYGLYCPSRAKPGEPQNDKGYCALRFAE